MKTLSIRSIEEVVPTQLEITVYVLVAKSGMTYADVGKVTGFTRERARNIYGNAAGKIQKLVQAGLLEPEVKE